jgi:hypothetical protein
LTSRRRVDRHRSRLAEASRTRLANTARYSRNILGNDYLQNKVILLVQRCTATRRLYESTVLYNYTYFQRGLVLSYLRTKVRDTYPTLRSNSSRFQVRSTQKFFTHRPVSTFDRVPFQLTGELFLYRTHLNPPPRRRPRVRARSRPERLVQTNLALLRERERPLSPARRPRARIHRGRVVPELASAHDRRLAAAAAAAVAGCDRSRENTCQSRVHVIGVYHSHVSKSEVHIIARERKERTP